MTRTWTDPIIPAPPLLPDLIDVERHAAEHRGGRRTEEDLRWTR